MPISPVRLSIWDLGINSLLPPSEISSRQYAWGENIINRGGIVQTRPGRKLLQSLGGTHAQGICIFQPRESVPKIMLAIDGNIYSYTPPDPLLQYTGISLSAHAEKITFCVTLRSASKNSDGSIKLITPTPMLMMSDGEITAWWDGSGGYVLRGGNEARGCDWMAWVSSRLWIAKDSKVYASDLADPINFTEGAYLSMRDAFELPAFCTGLIATPNRAGLLAFTKNTTTVFNVTERDRAKWQNTPNFQDVILENVGCVAGRTAVNQYGLTHWLSERGMVSLDIALLSQRSNRLITEDEQMMRSRRKLNTDQSDACAAVFENFMFVSVPSGSKWNNHTWVMDQAPLGAQSQGAGVWASIWTGTRPVQWASGTIGGRRRIFSLCYDVSEVYGYRIHLWEDMQDERLDNGGRIACQWITGGIGSPDLIKFNFAKFEAVEILGYVDLAVSVAGTRGPWYGIGEYALQAEQGSIGASGSPKIKWNEPIRTFKPQSRPLVTKSFVIDGKTQTSEHTPYSPGVDRSFQLAFEWLGRMGIRELTVYLKEGPDETKGEPACLGNGKTGEYGEHNAINERGEQVYAVNNGQIPTGPYGPF